MHGQARGVKASAQLVLGLIIRGMDDLLYLVGTPTFLG
jgi:hypothetical protein